jgi:glycosyltransferase involved in cell wall biosynthesis
MSNILSLIIPVYANEGSIPDLLQALNRINHELEGHLEVVFVVDGSPDRSYEILHEALKTVPFCAKLLLLTRNFGSFSAIRAGLEAATGERFAVMAADLQEPPEFILEMNKTLLSEEMDIVVGVRDARRDPFLTRLPSQIFWSLYRWFVMPEIPPGGVDMFACTKSFRDQLLKLEERHSSLIAQIFWMGYRRKLIEYTRQERKHGKSAWTFGKKFNYFMDSVFSFTDLPLSYQAYLVSLLSSPASLD